MPDVQQSETEIRRVAKQLDDAIEAGEADAILSCFADDGEIELFGIRLKGKTAARKGIEWMYANLGEIHLEPVVIMVQGDVFFEEFVIRATRRTTRTEIKAAEVLVYEDYRVKSLRLYLDRLQLAEATAKSLVERAIARRLDKTSLKGLT
jgi:ketosteroid isomerase-like protein